MKLFWSLSSFLHVPVHYCSILWNHGLSGSIKFESSQFQKKTSNELFQQNNPLSLLYTELQAMFLQGKLLFRQLPSYPDNPLSLLVYKRFIDVLHSLHTKTLCKNHLKSKVKPTKLLFSRVFWHDGSWSFKLWESASVSHFWQKSSDIIILKNDSSVMWQKYLVMCEKKKIFRQDSIHCILHLGKCSHCIFQSANWHHCILHFKTAVHL